MTPEQEAVATWMRRTLEAKDWKPGTWAKEADMTATNITRAMKDDTTHTTSLKTLDALAKAARVPSVLDFLKGQAEAAAAEAAQASAQPLGADALAQILDKLLPSGQKQTLSASTIRGLASALAHGLESLGARPAKPATPDAVETAARAAAAQLRSADRPA